jgi:hypothetical protein
VLISPRQSLGHRWISLDKYCVPRTRQARLASVAAHAESTLQQANFLRFATRQLALTDAAIKQEMLKVQQATGEQWDLEMLKLKQLIDRRQQQVQMLKELSQQLSQGN